MNKLDEIDKEAGDCQDDGDAELWMKDYAALLIRAVRQLGALYDAEIRRTDKSLSINLTIESLDPDVLELIAFDKRT